MLQWMATKWIKRQFYAFELCSIGGVVSFVRETCKISAQSGDKAYGMWLPETFGGIIDYGQFEWLLWPGTVERRTQY